MGDYYTNTSDYPSDSARYAEQPIIKSDIQQPIGQQAVGQQAISQQAINPNARLGTQAAIANPMLAMQYKYNNNTFSLDFKEVLKRAVKYLVEGLAVAFVAYYFIGKGKLNIKDIVMLGITAAFVFAILDTFSPTIALGARFGAGFGIGQGLFGLNPGLITPVVPVV